ncbi:NAD(P)-dependent oxidoreductase [Mycobacterium sp. 236(2023)]|uniref:NAD(P)-dependent oxidoreductase n=1 Tax=Mycobacterium sp. 236(2023) TaxID=3038163 RepID=UPI0024157066|nr:NAD(P)-dependent oxidoreductase [Mycobacterium sp. 236(2023)]MDG4668033.1 NAD(P)-dependent oxidoreductase [Mycobacterium sp. 236(2023)]
MTGSLAHTDAAHLAVGFIGLGDQGLPMASAIAQAGLDLHVWARRPASLDALGDTPRIEHAQVNTLAQTVDIVILCVPTEADVLTLLTEELLPAAQPGTIIVNAGTGTPGNATRAAELCAEADIVFLDAPVSGGRQGAEARNLTTMVGGPAAAFETASVVFHSYSSHVLHCGGHGAGQLVKLFNNTLLMMNQASIAEIIDLAMQLGIDPIALAEAIKLSSGASEALVRTPTNSPVSLTQTAAHLAQVELLDMDLFQQAMTEAGIDAAKTTARGIAGAASLTTVVALLNPEPLPAQGEEQ